MYNAAQCIAIASCCAATLSLDDPATGWWRALAAAGWLGTAMEEGMSDDRSSSK